MSGQTVPHIEYMAESVELYGKDTAPPFTCKKAEIFSIQVVRNGARQALSIWKYHLTSGDLWFATLGLNGKDYIVKPLPKHWTYGDAIAGHIGCTDWFVWQGPRQKFGGFQFKGPVGTTFVISQPANQVTVRPPNLKRNNAIEIPVQSKHVRLTDLPNPGRKILGPAPSSQSSQPLANTAATASLLAPYVSTINVERSSNRANIREHDRPIVSKSGPTIIDLTEETPEPEDLPLPRSINSRQEQHVDPVLRLKTHSGEKDPVKMNLSGAQAPNGALTMQSLFKKIDSVLPQYSGNIHTMHVAIVEKANPGADDSEAAKTKTRARMKICRVVDTTFEEFLALVEKHRELFRSGGGHITLTVAVIYSNCGRVNSEPTAAM